MRVTHLAIAALLLASAVGYSAEPTKSAKPARTSTAPAASTIKVTGKLMSHMFRADELKTADGKIYRLKGAQAKALAKAAGVKDHTIEVEGTLGGNEKSPILTVTAFQVLGDAAQAKSAGAPAKAK